MFSTVVDDVNQCDFLCNDVMRFNAFVFGLLKSVTSLHLCDARFVTALLKVLCFFCSHRALAFWVALLCSSASIATAHYFPSSFVALCASNAKHLFYDMIVTLQPLAKVSFR